MSSHFGGGISVPVFKEFSNLNENYLFTEVRKRIAAFKENYPDGEQIINLDVGDIAYPLPDKIIAAFVKAAEEMADNLRFRGYPPESGYDFLKRSIVDYYRKLNVCIDENEVFIGCGAKSDTSGFLEVFGREEVIITDPVYPVYLDAAVMHGNPVRFVRGNKDNGFMPLPDLPENKPYIIYLCSPNNPTGVAYGRETLKQWVDFALKTGSVILFDAAYSAFVKDGAVKSVYQIEGAENCCVEFCSFSKFAGFTGLRCSWIVIPEKIKWVKTRINTVWRRIQAAKFNGVAYPVQRAAEAALSPEGLNAAQKINSVYSGNAGIISGFLNDCGVWNTGAENSPYVWFEVPEGETSWEFFDRLLLKARIAGTPGCGFGKSGEGFFRISCFAKRGSVQEAVKRLESSGVFK